MTEKRTYPKRLIEVDLPIGRISKHASREKSIRHGHISTLHIWWARRPLAACRAVLCAALWPDPADELCDDIFREQARELMKAWARNHLNLVSEDSQAYFIKLQKQPGLLENNVELRLALLEFIADFANWDNSPKAEYLETGQALTYAAHLSLGGEKGTRPLVVDPFAGGGSIPLEALRVGADAFASDLNPVAVLLNKVVLEYIPKYGRELAVEIRKWGLWIKEQAEKELGEFYPKDKDGSTPIAYLWARTVLSEAPGGASAIPVEIPLMRSLWLAKKKGRYRALRWKRTEKGRVRTETVAVTYANGKTMKVRRPLFEIFEPRKESEVEEGTVSRGNAVCPVSGHTTPVESVRRQLKERRGGANDARMTCVVLSKPGESGKYYRLSDKADRELLRKIRTRINSRKKGGGFVEYTPTETISLNELRRISLPLYGIERWGEAFNERQTLTLNTLIKYMRSVPNKIQDFADGGFKNAILTCLALAISRQTDYTSTLCHWDLNRELLDHTFGRQAIPFVWDFAEVYPLSDSTGGFPGALEWIIKVCERNSSIRNSGTILKASATQEHQDDWADCFFTDPPYYDSVPYAYLSDYFYVWLKRMLGGVQPSIFKDKEVPKDQEIVVDRPHALSSSTKNIQFYEQELRRAFSAGKKNTKKNGIAVIVFASKLTASWEALVKAIIESSWTITGSWPIDSELKNRVASQGQARLQSSIHIVCRPRNQDIVGDWRDVLQELPQRIHAWLPRLDAEGVVGADAIFACLGPALEIFSRYSRVETASGETITLKKYLEEVWAAVEHEALSMIFQGAETTGLEEDARLTVMWLWTLSTDKKEATQETTEETPKTKPSGGYTLEYDAARKLAQGLGVELENLTGVIRVKAEQATLLPVSERAKNLMSVGGQKTQTKKDKKNPKNHKASTNLSPGEQLGLFRVNKQQGLDFENDRETSGETHLETDVFGLGVTVLDRVHQAMLLFNTGRDAALKQFITHDGADERFWKLADALSRLYPDTSEEKRWVDGVLSRMKSLRT